MAKKRMLGLVWFSKDGKTTRSASLTIKEAHEALFKGRSRTEPFPRFYIDHYEYPPHHLMWAAVARAKKGVYCLYNDGSKVEITAEGK